MPHSAASLPEQVFTTERGSRRTGDWRFSRPELDADACIMCKLCVEFCPDVSIQPDAGGEFVVVDYDYCKGCGICAAVCPTEAFEMVVE